MKVTDLIIEFLIQNNVTDIFGYPGGVICHLIDSATKYSEEINVHTNYHEQASAFAACGYAQESGNVGVAFSTSGPGATNLLTGIANAYYDSIPTIFFTGQVDTYGLKGDLKVRQRGFQETDIVAMVASITKYSVRVDEPSDILYVLEKAMYIATSGNPGPVLIDLPADTQRAEIEVSCLRHFLTGTEDKIQNTNLILEKIKTVLAESSRPCFLLGSGIKQSGNKKTIRRIVEKINVPIVTSMPAIDILPFEHELNYGFIGANGPRYGNFVLGKADLIITLGSRLDLKQVGNNRESFALNAKLVRIDIDSEELAYKVREDEIQFCVNLKELIPAWASRIDEFERKDDDWVEVCKIIKQKLYGYDDLSYTKKLREFCKLIPDYSTITFDVGQNQIWLSQHIQVKENQSVYMSGGHGAMGYSLPAAIGAYYANPRTVVSFNGDGGIQMNIQELSFLMRERIPVTIVVINNKSLGMIRGFQEVNFEKNYSQTIEGNGYLAPDFKAIAEAYAMPYLRIEDNVDIKQYSFKKGGLIEICISNATVIQPNFGQTGLIQQQRPYLDEQLYNELMNL